MAETEDGQLVAADAKIGFDDNAAFRHKDLFAKRDSSQEDPSSALTWRLPCLFAISLQWLYVTTPLQAVMGHSSRNS